MWVTRVMRQGIADPSHYFEAALTRGSMRGDFTAANTDLGFVDKPDIGNVDLGSSHIYDLTNPDAQRAAGELAYMVRSGALDNEHNSVTVMLGAGQNSPEEVKKKQEEESKRRYQDQILLMQLDQRIRALEASMARTAETLKEKYGEDFIGGMAAQHLSEEELKTARTDEERLQALSEKFLNPDGTIKEEYKGTPEAEYLRDWAERKKGLDLAARVETAGGNMTPELRRDVKDFAGNSNLTQQNAFTQETTNAEAREIVDTARSNQFNKADSTDNNTNNINSLNFG